MVKYLIIRFSSIGDIVLTTPVVRCLKQQVEGAEVHFLTRKQFSGILENNPYIDKVHVFDDNFDSLIDALKLEYFDYIIDLHHNLRTWRFKSKLKVYAFDFNKLNYEKWLMVNLKINILPDVHIVDRYMNTTKLFDVKNDQKGLDYFIPEKDEVNLNVLPSIFQQGYIGFVIGAKHFTKRMPVEKIISICKKIKQPIIILGGKEDQPVGDVIKQTIGDSIFNSCGQFNLNQSASLVKQAKIIISHDTGLMHIAAAFKKNILSLWGNTIPELGMYPYLSGEKSEILEVKGLKCRPCTKIGFRKCPKKHFNCMNNIKESKITEWVEANFK